MLSYCGIGYFFTNLFNLYYIYLNVIIYALGEDYYNKGTDAFFMKFVSFDSLELRFILLTY